MKYVRQFLIIMAVTFAGELILLGVTDKVLSPAVNFMWGWIVNTIIF